MYLVFLGPPGVGKGTQAKRSAEQFGVAHISTGDLLRESVRQGTRLGEQAKPFMEAGRLVPDDLIVRMTIERMQMPDCGRGVLLDGFPRTMAQAQALQQAMNETGIRLTGAFFFSAPDEILVERLSGRRNCSQCGAGYHVRTLPPRVEDVCDVCYGALTQRTDDRAETIRERITVYRKQSAPVVDHYRARGILREIRAEGSVDEIFARVKAAIFELSPESRVRVASGEETAAGHETSTGLEEKKTELRITPPGSTLGTRGRAERVNRTLPAGSADEEALRAKPARSARAASTPKREMGTKPAKSATPAPTKKSKPRGRTAKTATPSKPKDAARKTKTQSKKPARATRETGRKPPAKSAAKRRTTTRRRR